MASDPPRPDPTKALERFAERMERLGREVEDAVAKTGAPEKLDVAVRELEGVARRVVSRAAHRLGLDADTRERGSGAEDRRPDWLTALAEPEPLVEGVEQRLAGHVSLPTGRLIVCDPRSPLAMERIPIAPEPGRYPVLVGLQGRHILYLLVRFDVQVVARWEPARLDPFGAVNPAAELRGGRRSIRLDADVMALLDASAKDALQSLDRSELDWLVKSEAFAEKGHASLSLDGSKGLVAALVRLEKPKLVDAYVGYDDGGGLEAVAFEFRPA
jgi:hypothetical protein